MSEGFAFGVLCGFCTKQPLQRNPRGAFLLVLQEPLRSTGETPLPPCLSRLQDWHWKSQEPALSWSLPTSVLPSWAVKLLLVACLAYRDLERTGLVMGDLGSHLRSPIYQLCDLERNRLSSMLDVLSGHSVLMQLMSVTSMKQCPALITSPFSKWVLLLQLPRGENWITAALVMISKTVPGGMIQSALRMHKKEMISYIRIAFFKILSCFHSSHLWKFI